MNIAWILDVKQIPLPLQFEKFLDLAFFISSANHCDEQFRHDIVEMSIHRLRHAVEHNTHDIEIFKDLGDAIKLVLHGPTEQDGVNLGTSYHTRPSDSIVVSMARSECDDSDNWKSSYIMDTLQTCGLLIKRYFKNNLDDFDPGSWVFNAIEEIIHQMSVGSSIKCQRY